MTSKTPDTLSCYGHKTLKGCLYLIDNQGISALEIVGMLNTVIQEVVNKGILEDTEDEDLEEEDDEGEDDEGEDEDEDLEEGFTLSPPQDLLDESSGQPLVTQGWSPESDIDDPDDIDVDDPGDPLLPV